MQPQTLGYSPLLGSGCPHLRGKNDANIIFPQQPTSTPQLVSNMEENQLQCAIIKNNTNDVNTHLENQENKTKTQE